MIYEANTMPWKKGDVVIHDADAKKPEMLMRVIGFSRDGMVKTRYLSPRQPRTIWHNQLCYLHDPARFKIEVDAT